MAKPEHVYVGFRRNGQWTVKDVDDVSTQELAGLDFAREFRAFFASSQREGEERLPQQLESDRPFHALEYAGICSPGIDRVRSAVTAAGHTLKLDRREGTEEQEYGLLSRS
jgi:hypothetical protein